MNREEKTKKILAFADANVDGQFDSVIFESAESTIVNAMRKTDNPFLIKGKDERNKVCYTSRLRKFTKVSGCQFGVSYTNKKRNEQIRNGEEPTFEPKPMNGYHWLDGYVNEVCEKNTDATTKALRITSTNNFHAEVVWVLDGRIATNAEVEEIKSFLYETTPTDCINVRFDGIIKWSMNHDAFVDVAKFYEYETFLSQLAKVKVG